MDSNVREPTHINALRPRAAEDEKISFLLNGHSCSFSTDMMPDESQITTSDLTSSTKEASHSSQEHILQQQPPHHYHPAKQRFVNLPPPQCTSRCRQSWTRAVLYLTGLILISVWYASRQYGAGSGRWPARQPPQSPASPSPVRNWDSAASKAAAFTARLNLTEKTRIVTGRIGLEVGGCIGNIPPIERVGFRGLCLLDGPTALNRADLVSVFPAGLTTAASWDKDLIYKRGKALGEEFRDKGVHVGLGPVAGPLGRNQLGGRNWEGFSVDPYLTGVAMSLTIKGMQDAGVQAYNRLNQTYACENSNLLNGILKDELAFKGYVQSDWYATHSGPESINGGLDMNMPGPISQAETFTGETYWGPNITKMISDGSVTEDRIDEMIQRIMTQYYLFGQDSADYPTVDPSIIFTIAAQSNLLHLIPFGPPPSRDVRRDHSKIIRKLGAEATVLLKNVNGTLPLKQLSNIGVFGNDAADPADGLVFGAGFEIGTLSIGGGSGTGRHTYLVSPLEAIKAHACESGARVQYILNNKILAAGDFSSLYPIPDVCLVFLNTFASEGYDRTDIEADWNSRLVVENVARRCPNTVVVTHSAGINNLPWANNPNVTAILAAHLPGQESGNSIVDVLWGKVNPSGKLPYSIAANPNDTNIPVVNLTEAEISTPEAWQADFTEGLYIDYRHLDATSIDPLYEFGFGLSYTTFELHPSLKIKQLVQSVSAAPDPFTPNTPGGNPELWEPIIRLTARVTNTGHVAGSTVPQLYVSLPHDTVPEGTPVQVLRGFEKIFLRPKESTTVGFDLLRRDLSYWDVMSQSWVVPQGPIAFRVGFSSRDIKTTAKHVIR
ncbi:hypothetical protein N0V92_000316 [Colletotrichum tropicale]|nr:hypothetical protein N0V92_000316 [Colletotrichum tropicale]